MRVLSPRMEPPETRGRWVHRQHRHFVALADQIGAQRLNEGGLAYARHAADTQAQRLAGVRQQSRQQLVACAGGGRRGWIPAG